MILGWFMVLGNTSSQLEQALSEESVDKWPQNRGVYTYYDVLFGIVYYDVKDVVFISYIKGYSCMPRSKYIYSISESSRSAMFVY